jgi:hypothetical protein
MMAGEFAATANAVTEVESINFAMSQRIEHLVEMVQLN